MAYQKTYNRINWENYPSIASPLNETNLNGIDYSVDEQDNRIIELDTSKLDLATAYTMVKSITLDNDTGIFTITYLNGTTTTIDTKLEKLAVNMSYDATTQQLVITLDDGTIQYVDMSALITQYEFNDTDTIAFTTDTAGEVSAQVVDGSITESKLQPNYLADIKVEVAKAETSKTAAATSEANAKASEEAAALSETNAAASEQNAKASEEAAAASETNAKLSETNAKTSETAAALSETNAAASEQNAKASEEASAASESAAAQSEQNAAVSESNALSYELLSKSYAVGTNGEVRVDDATDNAKYYYTQTKEISTGMNGVLLPMGTITFSELQNQTKQAGFVYNISDSFTSDETFTDGGGLTYPAGTNVYYTSDGTWDCFAGIAVIGVKGDAETDYRTGNVNITIENVGLGTSEGVSTIISNLDTETATPTDSDYLIAQTADGGDTSAIYKRKPFSALWEYVKGKIESVLGLTANTYAGNAATATTLETARSINGVSFDGSTDITLYELATLDEIDAMFLAE